jgi:nucleoside-diphosphate-sugar epimerase
MTWVNKRWVYFSMGEFSKSVALVTGATGFIGGRLAERLVEAGWSVRVLVRDPQQLAATLNASCQVVVGNLANLGALKQAVQGADVVFHCAANVSTWDSWGAYEAANVHGVQNLLDAIVMMGNAAAVRLVHVSTVDVYGFPDNPCDETCSATGGEFGYGRSKWLGESLVRTYGGDMGIPYTIIRPANVIGPGSQFISRIGDELRGGLMLTVDGGRVNAGTVYIDNLVDYMIWAAGSEKALGQCYNVRDAYDVTWGEFVRVFRKAIKGRGLIVSLPFAHADAVARMFEGFYRVLMPGKEPLLHRLLVRLFGRTCGHSAEKIRSDSGMVGKVGFDEAVEKSVRWYFDKHVSR